MATTLKFDNAQDTLEAATKLLELTLTNEVTENTSLNTSLNSSSVHRNNLPTFSEWWQNVLSVHRNNLRITSMNGVTSIRFKDYKAIIKPLLGNPVIKRSNILVSVGTSGLVEARISVSQIRRLAVKKGICLI